jgi:hypothetical protein
MVVVYDAVANMKAVIRKSSKPMTSFVCMDHRLQTCLRKAFAEEDPKPIEAILKKATNLASLMHQSPTACQLVQAECEAVGISYIKVITPVATRWNSRYLMVQSINTIGQALSSLNEKNGMDLFTDDQLQLLKDIEKVLSKFKEAMWTFSIDKSPSMPEVIPTIINLKGYVTRWLQNPPDFAVQGLCEALKRQLDIAWPDCATSEREPAMASIHTTVVSFSNTMRGTIRWSRIWLTTTHQPKPSAIALLKVKLRHNHGQRVRVSTSLRTTWTFLRQNFSPKNSSALARK